MTTKPDPVTTDFKTLFKVLAFVTVVVVWLVFLLYGVLYLVRMLPW